MKLLTGLKKSYVINTPKLEALKILGQQIQASNEVKEGMSFFEGFEVLAIKTFHFNSEAVSIYRAVLKVKEKGEKVIVESTINTHSYAEFSLLVAILLSLFFSILIAYHYLFYPIFNLREPNPAFGIFGFIWLFSLFLGVKRINKFRLEGQKVMDTFIAPLKA
jgi:hypothetical protein